MLMKRHILVDTLGLILAVVVTAANGDDRQGLVARLNTYFASGIKRLRKIWVDEGYEAQWLREWARGLKRTHKIDVEVVERTGQGFEVVKQRWKVERSFAWIVNDRRHSRDYEVLTACSEPHCPNQVGRLARVNASPCVVGRPCCISHIRSPP
jgi:putative transposase